MLPRHSQIFTKHKHLKPANHSSPPSTIAWPPTPDALQAHGRAGRPLFLPFTKALGKASDQEERCYKNNIELLCVCVFFKENHTFLYFSS